MAPEKQKVATVSSTTRSSCVRADLAPAVEIFEGIESLEMHNNVFFRVGGCTD